MLSIKDIAIEYTIDKAIIDVNTKEYVSEFVDLTDSEQLEFIGILFLALKNILKRCILAGKEINLPYIGILKVKDNNKFAIRRKIEVANKLGYITWNNIPKDKLNDALKEVRGLVKDDIIASKNGLPKKRVSHQIKSKQSTKVFRIKLKKIR